MLAVSGRLDRTLCGPSVPVHLTPFMDGRGRPGSSGPLDGDGRRSLYLDVRRNFLSPMILAFDTPIPFTTMGRRQRLERARPGADPDERPVRRRAGRLWAQARPGRPGTTGRAASSGCTVAAFGRPPTADESAECLRVPRRAGRRTGRRRRPAAVGRPGPRAVQRERVHLHELSRRNATVRNAFATVRADRRREMLLRCANGFGGRRAGGAAGRPARSAVRDRPHDSAVAPTRHHFAAKAEERHLPVHGRRAVAGRHVRPQAAARPRARPAVQDEDRADAVQQRRQRRSASPVEVPAVRPERHAGQRPVPARRRAASTTWRSSAR